MDRAERERKAYDEDAVWEHSNRWHQRFSHVFESPNTLRHERLFEDLQRSSAPGKRVLELGCGDGENAARLLSHGADYVFGVDVSESFLERAQDRAVPGRLAFAMHDATEPFSEPFDLIVGRAILHHIDYRDVIGRLHDRTLQPGGMMIFMEPLGSNALIRLFTLLAPRAHTPDERSFRAGDLRWFREHMTGFELYPFNYATLLAGIVSSRLLPSADNAMLRAADRIDVWLARHARWLEAQFRQAVLVIRKPG